MSAAKRRRKPRVKGRGQQLRPMPQRKGARITATSTDDRLRERIQQFAFQPRFSRDFDQAMARFFGEEAARTRTLVLEETDLPAFQEWYFFDYLTGSGERLIDIFAREEGPALPEKEREYLDLWRQWNRYRLFEVQEVKPGTGIVVTDLLSGETLEVHDRSASHNLKRWETLVARPLYTDRLHFTGPGVLLSPLKKQAVLDYSHQLLADFQARNPQATLDEFYQHHGLDIRQFMMRKAEERPVWITPEGHILEVCTAYYRVADGQAAARRLEEAEEFNLAGPSAGYPGTLHFNWLLRGRSHVPEGPKPTDEVLTLESQWFLEPGSPKYRSLGDIVLWPNRLELSCFSRARLEAGKALLETVLGRLIRHRRDKIEPLEEFMAHQAQAPSRRQRIPPHVDEAFQRETLRQEFDRWADQPKEPLGGKTPREAVRDPEGRAMVIEMLKIAEYLQEQRREAGEPWFDVNQIRRQLGLPIA